MIMLGDILLPKDLVWIDRFRYLPVAQSARRTVGGASVIRSDLLLNGREITLEAQTDMGWLDRSMVLQLIAIASVPGTDYEFNFHDQEIFTVKFRHHDPPAIDLTPLVDGYQPSDYFIGQIKLITV